MSGIQWLRPFHAAAVERLRRKGRAPSLWLTGLRCVQSCAAVRFGPFWLSIAHGERDVREPVRAFAGQRVRLVVIAGRSAPTGRTPSNE
jgi:hypothetical protein